MEGEGAYNRHAKLQASGASLAASFLESAARKVAVGQDDRPIVVADYGSSQGKNSLIPLRAAIGALRSRFGRDRPILVFHVDQPLNDFNSLFQVLDSDAERYTVDDKCVFPSAIGRSFYERVLPRDHVHLAWSSYAAVWLSHLPTRIPGHFFIGRSTGAIRSQFERQGARDWETFLALRAAELRLGGRMVVVLPARDERDSPGFGALMDHANAVLGEMVKEGGISTDEREQMIIGSYSRRRSELLAPFARLGHFQDLVVEALEVFPNPDPAWQDYEQDGDAEALAEKHARFFRATFVPSLASALVPALDTRKIHSFGDRLEKGLTRRLSREPTALGLLVQTIVLAKRDPSHS
jgi:hypothetical protein